MVIIIMILAALFFLWRSSELQLRYVLPALIKPEGSFTPAERALDYALIENWAAHPDKNDPADQLPEGMLPSTSELAIFFVHPTTLIKEREWNFSIKAERDNAFLQDMVLPAQPSAFAVAGEVYAPYYRQTSLYTFLAPTSTDSEAALEFAYADVVAAFNYFIENEAGARPFVLAGHSQGAFHLIRLMQEQIMGTPLEARLVAAYLPGARVNAARFEACQSDDQIGCVLSWNSFIDGSKPPSVALETHVFDGDGYTRKPFDDTLCAPPPPDIVGGYTSYSPQTGLINVEIGTGHCVDGVWFIHKPNHERFLRLQLGRGGLHVHDYGLVWRAVGLDVEARFKAWQTRN